MTIRGKSSDISVLEVSRALMPGTPYEVVVLDLWVGDRDDLATQVDRYMLCYEPEHIGDHLYVQNTYSSWELAKAENASMTYRRANQVEGVKVWESMGRVKNADRDAVNHSDAEQAMLDPERRRWYHGGANRNEKYEKFLEAIDILAINYEDEGAWADVDAFRRIHAEAHEK